MARTKIEVDLENEKEWRRTIYSEVKGIRSDLSNLRVKVAVIGTFFGILGSGIVDGIKTLMGK